VVLGAHRRDERLDPVAIVRRAKKLAARDQRAQI
jgi:hypothetical protein